MAIALESPSPARPVRLPKHRSPGSTRPSGVDVYAWSRPARAFSGDFYLFDRADDALGFCLGDVSGKGLDAAVVVAMIRETLEELRADRGIFSDLTALPAHLTRRLSPVLAPNRFVTLVAGRLEQDGRLELLNAGHCPPVVRHGDGAVTALPSTGPIVSALPLGAWQTLSTRLKAGDALVLYSDGIPEAEGETDAQEFGVEGLLASVAAATGPTAEDFAGQLLADVIGFSGPRLSDDTTVMAIVA